MIASAGSTGLFEGPVPGTARFARMSVAGPMILARPRPAG
jgi:hypothetical protein